MPPANPKQLAPEKVLLNVSDSLATVVINRPQKLNALNLEMWVGIANIFADLNKRTDIRCVILQGAGEKAFGPGADISEFSTKRKNSKQAKEYGKNMHAAMEAIRSCCHPVLAKIRGLCVGGSLELALVCDVRIASENSKFGVPINKLGLVMAQPEVEALVRLVGPSVSLEILYEGRIFDAREAKEKGLLNRIVSDKNLDTAVEEIAQSICASAPLVNRWHKNLINRIMDTLKEDKSLREEYEDDYACFDTEDYRKGVKSFLEKKTPIFKGR